MNIEISTNDPSIDIVNGAPFLSFYFSDAGPLEREMYEFIDNVDFHDEETTLTIGLPLRKILDATINGRRTFNFEDRVVCEPEVKPFFDAVRADLIAAIALIDGIEYQKFEPKT